MTLARFLTLSTLLAGLSPLAAFAQPAAPADGVYITRDQLPALVREVLMNNPEIITDAVKKLRAKTAKDDQQKAKQQLGAHKADLYNDPDSPSAGNKAADVTLVEFYDYHCGYCKRMMPTIAQLLKEDKKIRVIFKEFPILSEDSVTASEAALAVNHIAKDKFFDFHMALMKYNGKFDEASILKIAEDMGIDGAKLKTEMAKPEINAELQKNHQLGVDLGIRGTPALIIGDTVLPGAVEITELKSMIATARSGKKIELPQEPEE